jgi:hypothetical protein
MSEQPQEWTTQTVQALFDRNHFTAIADAHNAALAAEREKRRIDLENILDLERHILDLGQQLAVERVKVEILTKCAANRQAKER